MTQVVVRNPDGQTAQGSFLYTSGPSVPQLADFAFLGCFRLPSSVAGAADPCWGNGLAYRTVNGQRRVFACSSPSGTGSGHVYECSVPATLGADCLTATPATLVRDWGSIRGTFGSLYFWTLGLQWDEPSQRLFWTQANMYNSTQPTSPSMGWSTLDPATNMVTAHGWWGLATRIWARVQGGFLAIPSWFSDTYCPGRRVAIGCGGPFSGAAAFMSSGPALTAFNPTDLLTAPSGSFIANTPLVSYPWAATPYSAPRCHRDPDYSDGIGHWDPQGPIGYWQQVDNLWQSMAWVDTPTHSAVVVCGTMGNGQITYSQSNTHAERGSYWWLLYDPADLARVAQGLTPESSIQPVASWRVTYPGMDPTSPHGFAGAPAQQVVGVHFDPQTATLSVAVRFAKGFTAGNPIVVNCYQVQ